jgi:transcription elongation factor GreA
MSTVSYYTAEGLKKLREELDHLKSIERPKASQAIAEARDKGDLSENAEYDAAKEAQGMLEMRIAKLEEVHSNARLIDETNGFFRCKSKYNRTHALYSKTRNQQDF